MMIVLKLPHPLKWGIRDDCINYSKVIEYMSVDELLKLREYFKAKVEQEQNKYSANNRGRIKYVWQMR